MSSLVADATAAVYALTNTSGLTGPGMTTKPRSCNSEVASIGSSLPAANVLNQSNIISIGSCDGLTTQAQRPRPRDARIATATPCRVRCSAWLAHTVILSLVQKRPAANPVQCM